MGLEVIGAYLICLVLVISLLTSCATSSSVHSVLRPPAEYQGGETRAHVLFTSNVNAECKYPAIGCAQHERLFGSRTETRVVMPDPCTVRESYADLLCHELAHVKGWRHAE
jgi:hypothetical protein